MLKGHTRNIPLTNILQTLVLNQQGGILSVQFQKMERHLLVRQSGVTLITERPYSSHLLQETLTRLGMLTGSEYQNVMGTAASVSPPGDLLLERHLITPEQVMGAISEQFREALYEIFEWRNASYAFDLADLSEDRQVFATPAVTRALEFPVNAVLMEVARREDEWSRIRQMIPHPLRIYRIAPTLLQNESTLSRLPLSADRSAHLVNLLTQALTLEEILERCSIPPFFVFTALRQLIDDGHAVALTTEEKTQLAEQCRQQFQTQRMEVIYRSILADAPDELETRRKLLVQLERRKAPPGEVLHHLHYLAATAQTAGQADEARELLERILKLDPHDLDALENITRMQIEQSGAQDRAKLLAPYARTVRSRREYDRGASFLLQISALCPQDGLPLQEAAHLHLLAGKIEEALSGYEAAAQLYFSEKRFAPLRKVIEKLAMCDERSAARWRKVLAQATGTRGERRITWKLGVSVCVMLLVGLLAFITYEWDARVSYAEVLQQARTQALVGNLVEAEQMLRSFQERHPFTLIGQGVFGDLRELVLTPHSGNVPGAGSLGGSVGSFGANTGGGRSTVVSPQDLSDQITRATLLKNQGDYAGALELYEALDTQVIPELLSRTVRIETEHLRTYVAEAARLYELAGAARVQGDTPRARQHLLELLDRFPHSPVAHTLKLPLVIEVRPGHAVVTVDGQRLPGPPYVLEASPNSLPTLRADAPGFTDQTIVLDPRRTSPVCVQLQRRPRWITTLDSVCEAQPLLLDGRLFLGTRSGRVVALDAANGTPAWQISLEGIGDPLGRLHRHDGSLVFTATDRHLYRLDRHRGAVELRVALPAAAGLSRAPLSVPDERGRIFAVTQRGHVLAYDLADGSLLWQRQVTGAGNLPALRLADLTVVGTHDGRLAALAADTGKERWSRYLESPIAAGPVIASDGLLVATESGRLVAVEPRDGTVRWSMSQQGPLRGIAALPEGDCIVVGGAGTLHRYDPVSGREIWRREGLGTEQRGPVIARNCALVVDALGTLHAFDLLTGHPAWTYQANSAPAGTPVAFDGLIVLPTSDHKVHLLDSAAP